MTFRPSICLVFATLLVAGSVGAQTPGGVQSNKGLGGFQDGAGIRLRTDEERGIKAGSFMLWPSLIIEGRWDSNLFRHSETEKPMDAPVFRFLPALGLSNSNPNKLGLKLGVGADIRYYPSDVAAISDQTGVGVNADLRVDILPRSAVSVVVRDKFQRELEATNLANGDTYDHNHNEAEIQLAVHPGGRALDISLGYAFVFDFFDNSDDSGNPDAFNGDYMTHDFRFLATWKFYPKTLALLEATFGMLDWVKDPKPATVSTGHGIRVDHMPFRTYVGLNGFITKKLSALLKAGYGNSFHSDGPTFSHFIGQGELGFKFTPTIMAAAGFTRDYSGTAFYSNYYLENKTYLRGQMRIARRVGIDLVAAFHLIDYAEFDPAQPDFFVSHKERRDQLVSGHAKVDVDILRWLGVTVGYEVQVNLTNFHTEIRFPDGSTTIDDGKYVRHQVYGSVNVRY